MATLDNKCFMDFQKPSKQIRIPGIQRDYAEGRHTKKVEDIRRSFLNELLKPIFKDTENVPLDFIYGYDRDGVFEPLDGQQRLTTLFLLHWFFLPVNSNDLLVKDQKESLLSYATRTSTVDFCNILVHQSASEIYSNWFDYNASQEDDNKKILFSNYLRKKGWFEWQWQYDPSIMSMLVVMDEVCALIESNKYIYSEANYNSLKNITFHLLNLEEFDLGDELYVKMNARGKQLSSFDILKSTLEEEIQLQRLSGTETERDWRSNIDGDWINYFWQRYSSLHSDELDNIDYKDIENSVEMQLKALLQRYISIQYYTLPDSDFAHNSIGDNFDEIIPLYCNLAWKSRTDDIEDFPEKINFNQLINDLCNLFYKDSDNQLHIATEFLDKVVMWQPAEKIFDKYMEQKVNRDLLVAFYSIVIFLRRKPASTLAKDITMQKNFQYWMRFIRNIVLLDNTQQRIDKPVKQFAAVEAINSILEGFFNQSDDMIHYIATLTTIVGLENAVIQEEILKAQCIVSNTEWQEVILSMENNPYLWGQIIAPLEWSMQNGIPNIELYKLYADKLNALFPLSNPNKFRATLLSIENYGIWKGFETLYLCEYNMQRDRSFKSFLRSANSGYGESIRKLIDIWNNQYFELTKADDFMDKLCANMKPSILQDWRRIVIQYPEVLDYAGNCILWVDNISNHIFLRQKQRSDTQHRELLLNYIWVNRIDQSEDSDSEINDWYPENQNSNSLVFRKHDITVKLDADGKYSIQKSGCGSVIYSADEVLKELRNASIIR